MGDGGKQRERTCIGCGLQSGKAQLMRIVRGPDGSVRFDASGRAPGRGAYVCGVSCLESATKGKKLQRALKTAVAEDELKDIVRDVRAASVD